MLYTRQYTSNGYINAFYYSFGPQQHVQTMLPKYCTNYIVGERGREAPEQMRSRALSLLGVVAAAPQPTNHPSPGRPRHLRARRTVWARSILLHMCKREGRSWRVSRGMRRSVMCKGSGATGARTPCQDEDRNACRRSCHGTNASEHVEGDVRATASRRPSTPPLATPISSCQRS